MGAAQGIGHAAGGDDEGFDHKGPEDKGQDKGNDQGFDGFFEGVQGAFSVRGGMRMRHNQIFLSFSVIFGQYISQPVEIIRKYDASVKSSSTPCYWGARVSFWMTKSTFGGSVKINLGPSPGQMYNN